MPDLYQEFIAQKVVRRKQVLDLFEGNVNKTNAALQWLLKSGKAQRIKTGLFYLKSAAEWQKQEVTVLPWHIAAHAVSGSVVAYHSALSLQAYTYSEVKNMQLAVNNELNRVPAGFEYQNVSYEYSRTDLSFGITSLVADNVKINSFDKERIIVEGLMNPDKFYGMAEFLQSTDDIEWLDLEHLLDIVNNYPRASVSMRLGWLLETKSKKWYVNDSFLNKLHKNRPQDRVFLVNKNRKGNTLVKTWNLMVPKKLLSLM